MDKHIAAVILAGGKSSRMGRNKALLELSGQTLLDHMIGILRQTGLNDIYVSGDFEGYQCIPDSTPHAGPAYAIIDVLTTLKNYDGVLFVPVDMPHLEAALLQSLIEHDQGGYFQDYPLPAFITNPHLDKRAKSVKALLSEWGILPIPLPLQFAHCMMNTNTPEEWMEA